MSPGRFAALCLVAPFTKASRADARPAPPLIEAVKASDTAAVRRLVRDGADVNGADDDGTTPLHWAVRRDHAELAELSIWSGAHPDRANRYGVTPLALAAVNGSAEMIKRLLGAGANAKAVSVEKLGDSTGKLELGSVV